MTMSAGELIGARQIGHGLQRSRNGGEAGEIGRAHGTKKNAELMTAGNACDERGLRPERPH
jgi:hypothetical protein